MTKRTDKQHTPGPWHVKKPMHGHPTEFRCVQIGEDETYSTLELYAEDARLISAAPDLLAACELVLVRSPEVSWLENGKEVSTRSILKSAIAKARGLSHE